MLKIAIKRDFEMGLLYTAVVQVNTDKVFSQPNVIR